MAGIFIWGHVSNVKYMYISAPGHTVDCIGFISGIYTDIVAPYVHIS